MELNKLQILLVDDDKLFRQLIDIFLTFHGATVTCCEDGISAYHKATVQKFDCIISDINIPEMNGVELLGKIRNMLKDDTPVILISEDEKFSQSQLLYKGAQAFLKKPFELPYLKSLLQNCSNST